MSAFFKKPESLLNCLLGITCLLFSLLIAGCGDGSEVRYANFIGNQAISGNWALSSVTTSTSTDVVSANDTAVIQFTTPGESNQATTCDANFRVTIVGNRINFVGENLLPGCYPEFTIPAELNRALVRGLLVSGAEVTMSGAELTLHGSSGGSLVTAHFVTHN